MAKRVIVGIDQYGNPIYADARQQNHVNPDHKPGKANYVNPDLQPAKWNPEMGRNPEVGSGNLGLSAAQKVQYGAAFEKPGIQPFAEAARPGGKPSLLVDYTKTPGKTTVPGQPGYDQSLDPFHQTPEQKAKAAEDAKKAAAQKALLERHPLGEFWINARGEKTGKSGLDAVHLDKWEAYKLRLELESMRSRDEALYPGARGRQHSSGGTNLGEPAWSGAGGGVFQQGANEWRMASGAVVGEGGIELVEVLDTWNIYEGQ